MTRNPAGQRPKSLPEPRFASHPDIPNGRKLIDWLFRGNDLSKELPEEARQQVLEKRRQDFAKYCRSLEGAAMVGRVTVDGAADKHKAKHIRERDEATDALVKLFLLFERSSAKRLNQFREIAPGSYLFCKQLREANSDRFYKAMSSKAGRSPRAHAIMVLCLMIEEEKANGKTTAQAVKDAHAEGVTKRLHPPAEERLRKYYNDFNRGLFAPDDISASRALRHLTRRPPSEPDA